MLLGYLPLALSRPFPKIGLLQFLRKASSFILLPNRELISLRGCAATEFLQGLMTNDARLIEHRNSLMYSLFLNVKVFKYLNSLSNQKAHCSRIICQLVVLEFYSFLWFLCLKIISLNGIDAA